MSEESKKYKDFISIRSDNANLVFSWSLNFRYKKGDGAEKFSCFMPSLDIYFSAQDYESMTHKGKMLARMYIDHFMVHTKKEGLKKLIIELHKSGFKTNDNYAFLLHKVAKNQFSSTKFKSPDKEVPYQFMDAESVNQMAEMSIPA